MRIGNKEFDTNKYAYIMGILNVTPDSFSDGGAYHELDKALFRAEAMIGEGADILDIGGESSRPGSEPISEEEEMARVLPVLEALRRNFEIPLSLDTCKSRVAKAGIEAGADMINDIQGTLCDPSMAEVIAQAKAAYCLMHNRREAVYPNFWENVISDFDRAITYVLEAGVPCDKIILDPGIGFAKSYEQNLELLKKLSKLAALGYPLLLGTSRKSVIGLTLELGVEERLPGTIATTVYGRMQGCSFFRVHDVKENKQALRMLEAMTGY